MSLEAIAITSVIGLLGGAVAGMVMKDGGYGLLWDTGLGVVGGVAGGFLLWMQGMADTTYALAAAAFVGGGLLVVLQRKFWSVELAPVRTTLRPRRRGPR